MASLLFAWEIGAGLGHSVPLAQVAAPLLAQGHAVHFALRDLSTARTALGALADAPGVRLWQAPVWLPRYQSPQPAASYAELLFAAGYLDAPRLQGLAQGWRSLLDAVQPALLVADHAPTALLAARTWLPADSAQRLRRALIGNGYFIPPPSLPLPPLTPWVAPPAARLAQAEALVLASCNHVLRAWGEPPLTALRDLLAADARLLLTWPELDPWARGPAAGAGHHWLGPLPAPDQGAAPAWPGGAGPAILAYLKGEHPAIDSLLAQLAAGPWRTLAHVPGLTAAQRRRHTGPASHLRLSEGALNLHAALPGADAVLCLGGAGTVGAALRAARPLLLLPLQAEQALTAHRVQACGAGMALGTAQVAAQLGPALQALLATDAGGGAGPYARAAAALAARHRQSAGADDPAGRAAALLAAMLAAGPG